MRRKCDKCDRPATYRSVDIINGQKIAKNLCEFHAAEDGLVAKPAQPPINELLTNFVKQHSGVSTEERELVCDGCGLTFSKFREQSLLGCPRCYDAFEEQLGPLLERAHEGGTHHLGKVPHRAGAAEHRQQQLLRMRQRLEEAVAAEDYEMAARLRDEIQRLEGELA